MNIYKYIYIYIYMHINIDTKDSKQSHQTYLFSNVPVNYQAWLRPCGIKRVD